MSETQVSVESTNELERRIRVQVPAENIDSEVEVRLKSVARTARIKGFRPGKVPAKVIRQHYGGQVRKEVLNEMLQSSYAEAIKKEELNPAGGPRIEPETMEKGQDLTYVATVEVYPEFSLTGIEAIKLKKPVVDIGDKDIDSMIETLRRQQGSWVGVDRKSKAGDQIIIDFEGKLKGEVIDGGRGEAVPVEIGQGRMLKEFEDNLLGLEAAAEKEFTVKFPKDYHDETLNGQKIGFAVTVKEVCERQLPELDADFIKEFGVASGEVADFRQEVCDNMQKESDSKVRGEIKRQVMDQLLAANPIGLPGVLVDQESASLQRDTMQRMGITDVDKAPPLESFRDTAEQRVRLGLLVSAVISENNLELDRDRIQQKLDEVCEPYENPDEIRKIYLGNQQLMSQIENALIEEQVIDWLVSQATVSDKQTTFDKLMEE